MITVKSPAFARPPPQRLNIDKCITLVLIKFPDVESLTRSVGTILALFSHQKKMTSSPGSKFTCSRGQ